MNRCRSLMTSIAFVSTLAFLHAEPGPEQVPGYGPRPELPKPSTANPAKKFVRTVGWPEGRMPKAPQGFTVTRFGASLDHPRWLYVLPNGDVLVAESSTVPKPPKEPGDEEKQALLRKSGAIKPSANRISLLRDANGDGTVDDRTVFLENLNQPFGMVLVKTTLFVANTDGVLAFPYREGQKRIDEPGKKILELPAGGYNNHWTRNIIANRDGTKLYVSVGSASNVAEHGLAEEERRANILECNLDGSGVRVFASGLRNPNGMDWEPSTGALWTVVNERDNLGDDLVPDYLTSVEADAFYGWPFSYFGQHVDTRVKEQRPELVAKARVPDYGLGAHTASLGLTFYRANAFPARYRGGAFIGMHGSWNRNTYSGYKVVFVPFQNGRPSADKPEDFLTGFLAGGKSDDAYGRPVGVTVDKNGALLVADDTGNIIWRVAATRGATSSSAMALAH
jgi:glucose/arabinose dehydrogenase